MDGLGLASPLFAEEAAQERPICQDTNAALDANIVQAAPSEPAVDHRRRDLVCGDGESRVQKQLQVCRIGVCEPYQANFAFLLEFSQVVQVVKI